MKFERGHKGHRTQQSKANRDAAEMLRKHPELTLKEVHARVPGSSLDSIRTYAGYHRLPYRRERARVSPGANTGTISVDAAKEAQLKAERESAPVYERARKLLMASFETLAKLWGPEVKK